MIEFLGGLAIGAMFAGAVVYAMLRQDLAERRSVPVPEPKRGDVPMAGETWQLLPASAAVPEDASSLVTVTTVIGGVVFYTYRGYASRTMLVESFTAHYRRA